MKRSLGFVIFVLAATALLLELTLQAGALVVHLATRKPSPPAANIDGQSVLCVGDSWTQGMGSSDYGRFSYPAVLEELLRQRNHAGWSVVNGGQAGQNSLDVIRRLPGQLDAAKPRIVCVLVGRNDYWTNPDEFVDGNLPDDVFRFRWRLPRLIGFLGDRGRPDEPSAPSSNRRNSPEWQPRVETHAEPDPRESTPWTDDEEQVRWKTQGWLLLFQEKMPEAIASFRTALARQPVDSDAWLGLVNCLRKAGSSEDMEGALRALRDNASEHGAYRHARALCRALVVAGIMEEARSVASGILARFPEDWAVWYDKAFAEYQLDRVDDALRSIDTCVKGWPCRIAFELQYQILRKTGDLSGSLVSIFRGYITSNDDKWALRWFSNGLSDPRVKALNPQRMLEDLDCPQEVKARLQLILEDAIARSDGVEASRVLSAHLRSIAALARRRGAEIVFLTYPNPSEDSEYGQPMREVAEELDIRLVDLTGGIAKKLAGRPWSDIASPDWHVNDEGYRFMAECVFEGLHPVLQSLK